MSAQALSPRNARGGEFQRLCDQTLRHWITSFRLVDDAPLSQVQRRLPSDQLTRGCAWPSTTTRVPTGVCE